MLQKPRKNPQILTDNPQSFPSLCLVETGLYEFHKMTMIVRKHNIENITSFVMIDFESISYLHYRLKTSIATEMDLKNSYKCFKALDNFAPRQKKILQSKQHGFHEQNFEKGPHEKKPLRKKRLQNRSESNKITTDSETIAQLFYEKQKKITTPTQTISEKVTRVKGKKLTEDTENAEILSDFLFNEAKSQNPKIPYYKSIG